MPITKSPLRYPGGKTQLINYVKYLLNVNNISETYIEPFAGGFGVGLDLLENKIVRRVVINDLDVSIYSVWYFILNHTNEFISKIEKTSVTIEEWEKQRRIREENKDKVTIENAFATFFLNRTNVSGIINGGPIGGKKQNGKYKIDCRFNKEKLIKKIKIISSLKDNIILTNLDANDFIKKEVPKYNYKNTFIFFDPPYYVQGKNLYLSFVTKNEHQKLATNILSLRKYKWIVTYDIEPRILELYRPYVKSYEYKLNYSANKKRKAREYIFVNNNTIAETFGNFELVKV
ncbi:MULTISPECIES: DNA adenine methylase [Lactobacillus]|uniref:DNA adenine methylase n=1 Tax=Lactobacillus TaxID=1578 RepID=UPI0014339129|nr:MULTISPECIES: DNA adenine methylase [Lactobacillus]MDO5009068.1 DNA adenine methylase [Lactobacillus johnsonii]GFI20573.1 hypothetical protein IMSAGC010_01130 [Lactobacillus johnsonii]